ncbi:MAG: ATP-binding protein [Anaerolineales bacterium]
MFHNLRWRVIIPYGILVLLSVAGLIFHVSGLAREILMADLERRLMAEAHLAGNALALSLSEGESVDDRARYYADMLDMRVTLIRADGLVLGESHGNPSQADGDAGQPEIRQARTKGLGRDVRFSGTLGGEALYVAVPVRVGGQVAGFLRLGVPLDWTEERIGRLGRGILSVGLFMFLASVALGLFIAERTARPVRELTHVVRRMTEGDMNSRLLPASRDEIGSLTGAFNRMADQLRLTIDRLARERSRLAAVLDNMADGVLITDGDARVSLINPAAARLLGTTEEGALGASFARVVRDYRIIDLWRQCHKKGQEVVQPVELDRREVFLQVIVTPLEEAGANAYLVILQDLTRVRHLEMVRRDFISNISHELRTPLASLKALVDTLREEKPIAEASAAQHFLDLMETEVDALTQMVRELLELSRIESGRAPFRLEPVAVSDVVEPPVERLSPQAERSDLELTVEVAPNLPPVLADGERMRQVVTNMVHNAIKFTPAGGRIEVAADGFHVMTDGSSDLVPLPSNHDLEGGEWVLIIVRDTGIGIPNEDLSRIFERFYKADHARSGGGTGLGMAIAKHIVQGHGGHIWAQSVEGEGSTFYVALPALTSY